MEKHICGCRGPDRKSEGERGHKLDRLVNKNVLLAVKVVLLVYPPKKVDLQKICL